MVPTVPTVGDGSTVTVWQLGKLVPQALPAVTHIVPEVTPKVTVANLVPCPEVILAPAGTVHVYTVVLGTLATE